MFDSIRWLGALAACSSVPKLTSHPIPAIDDGQTTPVIDTGTRVSCEELSFGERQACLSTADCTDPRDECFDRLCVHDGVPSDDGAGVATDGSSQAPMMVGGVLREVVWPDGDVDDYHLEVPERAVLWFDALADDDPNFQARFTWSLSNGFGGLGFDPTTEGVPLFFPEPVGSVLSVYDEREGGDEDFDYAVRVCASDVPILNEAPLDEPLAISAQPTFVAAQFDEPRQTFTFSLDVASRDAELRIARRPTFSFSSDYVLELRSPAGELVRVGAEVAYPFASAGTWEVVATGSGGTSMLLEITAPRWSGTTEEEPNDEPLTAGGLGRPGVARIRGVLGDPSDSDHFALPGSGDVSVICAVDDPQALSLQLVSGDGTPLPPNAGIVVPTVRPNELLAASVPRDMVLRLGSAAGATAGTYDCTITTTLDGPAQPVVATAHSDGGGLTFSPGLWSLGSYGGVTRGLADFADTNPGRGESWILTLDNVLAGPTAPVELVLMAYAGDTRIDERDWDAPAEEVASFVVDPSDPAGLRRVFDVTRFARANDRRVGFRLALRDETRLDAGEVRFLPSLTFL